MNKFIFMGRLTSDAVTRSTDGGSIVVRFRVAVRRPVKNEGQPEADFFSCVAFGKIAERMDRLHITKGTKLVVYGELHIDEYKDRDGNSKKDCEVVVRDFDFAESRGKRDGD